ncbi:RadC family protein [Hydromonas duriensis]|uniref:DNA replication and repair protein RadC n=1 Tax=Hydromonas duriensis TaxID=1527608 RepID=A0A4R6Y9D3_9BURK|nr:DNA repair protein RadC [Hydromonas duriensis]TDR32033.1 DNA replication and repair protein RadC [Hydromonas duriensis]
MPITDWLPETRPREKLLARGASALSDAELLAIFLRVGMVGKSAVDLAHELIAHFGSLSALFNARLNELSEIKGIGEAKYVQLQAVLEMSRRALTDHISQHSAFNNIASVKTLVQLHLAEQPQETLLVLFLTAHLNLIAIETIGIGHTTQVDLPIRDIVRRTFNHNAHGIILAHNHPNGNATPSAQDIESTLALQMQLAPLHIHVLDHLIVAKGHEAHSMVEHGQISPV